MQEYVFPPPEPRSLPVRGSEQRYAVNRIFCVGRNYGAHVREMGGDPAREPPFYFNKSPRHLLESGSTLTYPPGTRDLHHEVELVIALGQAAFRLAPEQAGASVWGYACGLDMTRRDLQADAKKAGHPWSFAKDFEGAAVVGELVTTVDAGWVERGAVELAVNGQVKQNGDLGDMIWKIPEIIANLSQHYHLQPGDLIFTGTPDGVGPVVAGDKIKGKVAGVGEIKLTVAQAN